LERSWNLGVRRRSRCSAAVLLCSIQRICQLGAPVVSATLIAPKPITAICEWSLSAIFSLMTCSSFLIDELWFWGYEWFVDCEYVAWHTNGRYCCIQVHCACSTRCSQTCGIITPFFRFDMCFDWCSHSCWWMILYNSARKCEGLFISLASLVWFSLEGRWSGWHCCSMAGA